MKDTLSFMLGYRTYQETVDPTINGQSLIEIVRAIELPFATAEGHPERAGRYSGLPSHLALAPSRYFLGEEWRWDKHDSSGRSRLLYCPCGYTCRQALYAKIEVTEDEVIWSDFAHHYRSTPPTLWSYKALGPFRFDKQQYLEALQIAPTIKSPPAERLEHEDAERRHQWDREKAEALARWQDLAERIQNLPRLLPQVLEEDLGRNLKRFHNWMAEHKCSPDGRALFSALRVLLEIGQHNECSEEFWLEMIAVGEQFLLSPPTRWP